MKENKHINLGDLVKLKDLEKPKAGVLKVELGGEVEKIDQLENNLGSFAEKIEDNRNIQVGDIVNLAEFLKSAIQKELLPEQAAELMATLKERFLNKEKFYKSLQGVEWADVQKKLEARPGKLWSLNEMENTKGEPDIIGFDRNTGEYIFMDCSADSPAGRRNCVYDSKALQHVNRPWKTNAVDMAAGMGIDLLTDIEYRKLQSAGEFDKKSWSWLKTPGDVRESGVGIYGYRGDSEICVQESSPDFHVEIGGFRGSLRV